MQQKISWCKKKGIRLIEPSKNLCNAYLDKAKSSAVMQSAAILNDEKEWIAITAYYARYFSVYALLQRCGIKSEIHNCTLMIFKAMKVNQTLYKELKTSKKLRQDLQYYLTDYDPKTLMKIARSTNVFIIRIEEIIEKISDSEIDHFRDLLRQPS